MKIDLPVGYSYLVVLYRGIFLPHLFVLLELCTFGGRFGSAAIKGVRLGMEHSAVSIKSRRLFSTIFFLQFVGHRRRVRRAIEGVRPVSVGGGCSLVGVHVEQISSTSEYSLRLSL